MTSNFRSAVFLQYMGTVGSGIFVLPYLFVHSNIIFASIFLIFLTVITAILNQFYVDIVSKTKGDHQLVGYASIYLGSRFKLLATLNLFLLSLGAVAAYTKLFISFFYLLVPTFSSTLVSIIFLTILTLVFLTRHHEKKLFIIIPIFMFFIPILLFLFSLNSPFPIYHSSFLTVPPSFLFFGASIFALSGFTIIPEVQEVLGTNKNLSLAILLGLILAVISYFLFSFSVASLSGPNLSLDSTRGLSFTLPFLSKVIALFGLVVTFRSSFGFLMVLRELFYRDLKVPQKWSNLLALLFPVLALLLKTVPLLTLISLTGHLTIFISAILICLIRFRLPYTFSTIFFSLLIIISLLFGLVGAIVN